MKKFLTAFFSAMLLLSALFTFGCGKNGQDKNKLDLYVPDGAPALSVARLLNDKGIVEDVNINVVSANTIQTFVTGENPKADFAIMPVNAAVKLLAGKEEYKLLGTVTNGNLFLMKQAGEQDITKDNLSSLVGKTVGVINLANVPGLTFKAILSDAGIGFVDVTESGEKQADKVNLVALPNGTSVVPNSDCNYFVVPEPAATTKQNATNGKISVAGSLQALYGEGNGYPQAVLVAKTEVISNNKAVVDALINSFKDNKEWLTNQNTSAETIVNAVTSGFIDKDMAPTFTAKNLNAMVINNCAINFTPAKDCMADVVTYIEKLNAISNNAWGIAREEFFFIG